MSNTKAKWLRQVAEELRLENHVGWGNVCEIAADEVDILQARIKELTAALEEGADLIQARIITSGELNTGLKLVKWHIKAVTLLKESGA